MFPTFTNSSVSGNDGFPKSSITQSKILILRRLIGCCSPENRWFGHFLLQRVKTFSMLDVILDGFYKVEQYYSKVDCEYAMEYYLARKNEILSFLAT